MQTNHGRAENILDRGCCVLGTRTELRDSIGIDGKERLLRIALPKEFVPPRS
jgi:hypothetical protein